MEDRPLNASVTPTATGRSTPAQSSSTETDTTDIQALSSAEVLALVQSSLEDDKAEDIVTIDLQGRSAMADAMVICSGRSARQVGAIAEKLTERLKAATGRPARIEGKDTGDWVLVDADDVIVHIFRPEVREFYQLEKMWLPSDALSTLRQPQPAAPFHA